MAHARTHILKSINISLKWIAWPVFLLSVYFLVHSFSEFIRQYPAVNVVQVNFSWSTIGLTALMIVLCLANWWLESFKWKLMVNHITPVNFKTAAHSVLMGCSFGFITPNRVGDYAGRTVPFDAALRPQLVTLNAISGFSQFLAVVFLGLICAIMYPYTLGFISEPVLLAAAVLVAIVFSLFIFMARFPAKLSLLLSACGIKSKIVQNALSFTPLSIATIFNALFISTVRAVVFVLQLVLVIKIISPEVSMLHAAIAGGVYFAVLTLSPSLVFNKLGLREALSVLILTPVTFSPVVAAVAVFLLWFINQVIPVLLGSVLLVKRSVQTS